MCVLMYLCLHVHSKPSVSLTLDLPSVIKSLLDRRALQLQRGGPYTSRLQLS